MPQVKEVYQIFGSSNNMDGITKTKIQVAEFEYFLDAVRFIEQAEFIQVEMFGITTYYMVVGVKELSFSSPRLEIVKAYVLA